MSSIFVQTTYEETNTAIKKAIERKTPISASPARNEIRLNGIWKIVIIKLSPADYSLYYVDTRNQFKNYLGEMICEGKEAKTLFDMITDAHRKQIQK